MRFNFPTWKFFLLNATCVYTFPRGMFQCGWTCLCCWTFLYGLLQNELRNFVFTCPHMTFRNHALATSVCVHPFRVVVYVHLMSRVHYLPTLPRIEFHHPMPNHIIDYTRMYPNTIQNTTRINSSIVLLRSALYNAFYCFPHSCLYTLIS